MAAALRMQPSPVLTSPKAAPYVELTEEVQQVDLTKEVPQEELSPEEKEIIPTEDQDALFRMVFTQNDLLFFGRQLLLWHLFSQ
eukprot:1421395-Pyramimonas_sp.AAC.1